MPRYDVTNASEEVQRRAVVAVEKETLANIEATRAIGIAKAEHEAARIAADAASDVAKKEAEVMLIRAKAEHVDVELMLIAERGKVALALAHTRVRTMTIIACLAFGSATTMVLAVSCALF